MCISKVYVTKTMNQQRISRKLLINDTRKELAGKFTNKVYNELYDGKIKSFSDYNTEYRYNEMKRVLGTPGELLGYGYLGYISDIFDIDIIVLNEKIMNLYNSDEYKYTIKGRKTIIIVYNNNKYEPVIMFNENNEVTTYYSPEDPIVEKLVSMMSI